MGYEAALEAAGLLDAWLDPDGNLHHPESHDVFLVPDKGSDSIDAGTGLNAVLVVEGDTVEAGLVHRVLARIGADVGAGETWVAPDGRWNNGPARGSWKKNNVEFLGVTAREESRRRKIAEHEKSLRAIEVQLSELKGAENELSNRLERLAKEVQQAPPKDKLVEAALAVEHTLQALDARRASLEEAEASHRQTVELRDEALGKRDSDAEDLGLRAWREPPRLTELKDLLASVRELAAGAWPQLQAAFDAASALRTAEQRLAEAVERRQVAERDEHAARAKADEAEAHYETLNSTVGVAAREVLRRLEETQASPGSRPTRRGSAREVLRRLEETQAAIRHLEAEVERLREEETEAATRLRINEREREIATDTLRERSERRAATVDTLNALVEHRIFEEADPELQPPDKELKTSPAVDLARRTEQRFQEVALDDESLRRAQTRLQAEFTTLNDQLGMREHHPVIEAIDAGAFKVTCSFQGKDRTMHELHDLLQDEVTQRERMLDAKEREVIENHLIGEVATELQQRIREGDTWRNDVNEELERRPTSSGIKLRFAWSPDPEGPAGLAEARRQILRTTTAWSQGERQAIGDFLHERIRAEQAQKEGASWQEHLTAALDYRAWHCFEVERYQDGQWKRLTKRTYGTSSGGEKALTLTGPQFAAAAAHYQSAASTAPRMILLDEVFVGIDGPTHSRLMGLLHSFDLDFVMTSEREWGCYPTLPSLAIYQLSSRPEIAAVHVTRWVWNGRDRVEGDGQS